MCMFYLALKDLQSICMAIFNMIWFHVYYQWPVELYVSDS